jgi:predicted permease
MDALRQDIKYAVRALRSRPWFSALAVVTLAIGIGVNAVAYSAINALLGKPMRFPDAHQLGWIQTDGGTSPYHQTALPDYRDLARETRTFEAVIAEARVPLSMAAEGGAQQVWGLLVSANYMDAMRAKPLAGRLLVPADAGGSDLPAVVSERFWKDRLHGGESLAGQTLTLNGNVFSIVGILPEGFQGPGGLFEPDLWLPLDRLDVLNLSPSLTSRETQWLTVAGRMKAGVTAAQAQADLRGIMTQLAQAYPATNTGRSVSFLPMSNGVPELRRLARVAWIGLAVVGIVLLIACFNVAGLLLARATERQREIGVRAALGASRGRLLRQLLVEGLVLASISGAAALVLAAWSADLLSAFSLPSPIPQRLHIVVDARMIAFTLALVAIGGVVPALIPALQASRTDVRSIIASQSAASTGRSRVRSVFVLMQIAGSTLFLAAALLFVRSFWNTASLEPGFDVDHTLVLELTPSSFGYDAPRAEGLFTALIERVRALNGVEAAALADRAPLSVGFPKTVDIATGQDDCSGTRCRTATEFGVSSDHFAALALPLRAGREFSAQEVRTDAPAVVIGEAMANALWPQGNAVGQSLRVGRARRPVQVVGVAADVKEMYSSAPRWYLYRPLRAEEYADRVAVIIRTAGDPASLTASVRQQVQALDPALPVVAVSTSRERMKLPSWPARTAAGFLAVCGGLALVLATVGLFGVTFYTVSQRTREFGVRVALGASPERLLTLVLREGLTLALPGVAAGIVLALLAVRFASWMLVGIGAADAPTYLAAALLQTTVALLACLLPAVKAMRADPMRALRQD